MRRKGAAFRHPDHGGPEKPVVMNVAGLEDHDHGSLRPPGIGLLEHCLVKVWVELLAERIDAPDPMTLEGIKQAAPSGDHPVKQHLRRRRSRCRVDRSLQIVDGFKKVGGEC